MNGDLTSWVSILLQTAAIIGSLGWFIVKLHLNVNLMSQVQKQLAEKTSDIDSKVKELSQVLIDLARQDMKIANLEARMNELSKRLYERHFRSEDAGER